MSEELATYLHDHSAASDFAVELLKHLHEQHGGEPVGELAAGLLIEVEEDRETLRQIMEKVGAQASALKEATAWVGEKLSRVKLSRTDAGEAGTFQALETMALGVLGKRALWRALAVIAPADSRLRGFDFEALAARAEAQYARVEEWRLRVAGAALRAAN